MLCEECGKNQSTIHFTKIINGEVNEMHLCEECAKKHKEIEFDSSFSVHNFLAGLLDNVQENPMKIDYIKGTTCDVCGTTYGRFKQTGRFGCSNCYTSFSQKLSPLFKRIHGHDSHVGKVPQKAGGVMKIRKEIEKLKNNLDAAVKAEEFERAAKIRDEIKNLQSQIQ